MLQRKVGLDGVDEPWEFFQLCYSKSRARESKEKIGWTYRDNSKLDSYMKLSNYLIETGRWSVYSETIHIFCYLGWGSQTYEF